MYFNIYYFSIGEKSLNDVYMLHNISVSEHQKRIEYVTNIIISDSEFFLQLDQDSFH